MTTVKLLQLPSSLASCSDMRLYRTRRTRRTRRTHRTHRTRRTHRTPIFFYFGVILPICFSICFFFIFYFLHKRGISYAGSRPARRPPSWDSQFRLRNVRIPCALYSGARLRHTCNGALWTGAAPACACAGQLQVSKPLFNSWPGGPMRELGLFCKAQ